MAIIICTQKTKLVDGKNTKISNMCIDNNQIYFSQSHDENGKFYGFGTFVNTDGTNLKKSNYPKGFLYNGWIYYTTRDKKSMIDVLYRENITSGNKELLVKDGIEAYNIANNRLYYVPEKSSSGYDVDEMDLNSKTIKVIMKNSSVLGVSFMNLTDKYIFLTGQGLESPIIDTVRIPIA